MFKMWSISQEVNITNFQRNEAILHSILLFHCRKYMSSHMMRYHTPDNLKPFVCKICTKGFLYKNQIDDHMNIHYGRVEIERQKHRSRAFRALNFSIRVISSTIFDFEFLIQARSSTIFHFESDVRERVYCFTIWLQLRDAAGRTPTRVDP